MEGMQEKQDIYERAKTEAEKKHHIISIIGTLQDCIAKFKHNERKIIEKHLQ